MNTDRTCPYPGCGRTISSEVFACKPHWFRLPQEARRRITSTWFIRLANPAGREEIEAHETAKAAAVALFTIGTKFPVCPACGHEDHAAFEMELVVGEVQYVQCEACTRPYFVVRGPRPATYTTSHFSDEPDARPDFPTLRGAAEQLQRSSGQIAEREDH
ncbi:MAG TPA: hypothetical protein VGS22_16395 [Thermoanaerobaculia bacterium]|nr:hypothetical protein [Thermoanaerobaculia bacterium]